MIHRFQERTAAARWAAALGVLWLGVVPTPAQTPFALQSGFIGEEVPPEIERMYERGLRYLISVQGADGSWTNPSGQTGPAIDGLCLMAFAAQGSDLRYGPYAAVVQRGLNALLSQQDANGYFGSSMYHHGFATLALAELYGMVDEPRLGPALERAINLILDAQKRSDMKAWRYMPTGTDADATVSGAQMVALFAARNAGLSVPDSAIAQGIEFYRRVQGPDGGIGYVSPDGGSPPRNAIAVVVASLAGQIDSRLFQGAWARMTGSGADQQSSHYLFYFYYYAAQAYFRADMNAWRAWNRATAAAFVSSQSSQGAWDGPMGATYCTASALLAMALNYRYLPIYER